MAIIDSHQHYWEANRAFKIQELPWTVGAHRFAWQEAGASQFGRDFLPADLQPQIAAIGCDRTVVVNALNNLGESLWMLELADATDSIAGVVGWVDLAEPPEWVAANLDRLRRSPKLCSIRHLVEFEHDDQWLLRPGVVAGLGMLEKAGVRYDLLVRPRDLPSVPALSESLPGLDMVIDHIAKPDIKNAVLEPWATDIRRAAENPRMMCKLSGMVTEADHQNWKPGDLTPYVEVAVDAFGTDRVMYGSDWPVCTLAGSYDQVHSALRQCLAEVLGTMDEGVERAIFHDNAERFYKLG